MNYKKSLKKIKQEFSELCSNLPGGLHDQKKCVEGMVNTMSSFFPAQFSQNNGLNYKKNIKKNDLSYKQ